MKAVMLFLLATTLAACGKSEPTDTVGSLVAHPSRLREVEKACSDDYAKMGVVECNAASEARHRLFVGNGPKYSRPKEVPKF